MVRRSRLLVLVFSLWLVLSAPVRAQSGAVRVEDRDGVLGGGAGAVREAAQRLAESGAQVIVLVAGSSAGTSAASADQYLDTFLAQNNLAPSREQLSPDQIVFFVARDARQTSLRFGQRWLNALRPEERTIQAEQMNPRFANGDIPGGLVAGIDAARTTINPPPPSRVPLYVIGGVLAATAFGVVAVPVLRKRRAAAETLAGSRARAEKARREAGAAIADLGQLVETAQAKAAYDRISYATTEVQRLQSMQGSGLQLFQEAQAAFDAAEEQQRASSSPTVADYEAIASQYEQARGLAVRASETIREAEQLRAELDARGTPSTGGTRRLGE